MQWRTLAGTLVRIVGIVGIACITDQFKSPIAVKDTPSFIEGKCPQQQNGELL